MRLKLALSLLKNKQYETAQYQLGKAKADNPPKDILDLIDKLSTQASQLIGWQINAGMQFATDSNINNTSASPTVQIGDLMFDRSADSLPQKDRLLHATLSAERLYNVEDQHHIAVQLGYDGKYYQEKLHYDDEIFRFGAGYSWQDAKTNISFVPFYQNRQFGHGAYSTTVGARSTQRYELSPQWVLNSALEYDRNRYAVQRYLNGHSLLISASVVYSPSASSAYLLGYDYFIDRTSEASERSIRNTLRIGTEQDLPWGFSATWLFSAGQRPFKDVPSLYGVKRRDLEYSNLLTLWHRQLNYAGFVAKLNWLKTIVKSNIDLFQYSKSQVFISVDRKF